MKIKALCSFAGPITMAVGEEREIAEDVLNKTDLVRAGYVEVVENQTKTKEAKENKADEPKNTERLPLSHPIIRRRTIQSSVFPFCATRASTSQSWLATTRDFPSRPRYRGSLSRKNLILSTATVPSPPRCLPARCATGSACRW